MATANISPVEREDYLNKHYGVSSWLFTTDHKRIALLYLISITLFFFIGGFFALLIRLELLTPASDLVQADTYNKLFTQHGMGGKTDENIEALEVVTYDGVRLELSSAGLRPAVARAASPRTANDSRTSARADQITSALKQIAETYATQIRQKYPQIPRRVSGYNLNYLLPENGFHIARALVGSEGTCATVLEATCRLVESPPQRVLAVVAYPDIYQCADHIPEILEYKPIGLEGFDDLLVYYERTKGINTEGLALLPEGAGWLMVEFGSESIPGAELQAQRMIDALRRSPTPPNVSLYSGANAKRIWEIRESSLGATSHVPGEPLNWEGWEDAAVAPEKLGAYLRDLRKMMADFNYKGSLYGHFGHACVHTRLNFDLQSEEGIAKYRKFVEEAADLVVSYGGSLSGEHGDGQARAEDRKSVV